MDQRQYTETQMALIRMGHQVNRLDLVTFLRNIAKSETMGPMIDPTLYRKAMKNLQAVKKMAEAARDFKNAFNDTIFAVMETELQRRKEKEQEDVEHRGPESTTPVS